MRRWFVVVLVVIAAGIAGGFALLRDGESDEPVVDSEPAASYKNVRELVSAMEANGLSCKKLRVSTRRQTREVGAEFGFCYRGEAQVNIHVYNDPGEIAEHVEGIAAVAGDDPNYFISSVYGPNWVVDTYSDKSSQLIQRAIGGTVRSSDAG